MKILVTGGAGYIGSHTCVELLENDYETVIVDNLYNSSEKAVERIEEITGKKTAFYKVNLLDKEKLNDVFDKEAIDAVIHFAGLKAVGESVTKPIEYYHNNLTGTLNLVDCMISHNVKNIIFSSSATVYGILLLSRSRKNVQREARQTHMVGQNGCLNRSSRISIRQTRSGMSSCSAISIRSAPMRVDGSAKTLREFQIISCPMYHRSL